MHTGGMRQRLSAAEVAELAELLEEAPLRTGVVEEVLQAATEGRGMTLVLADVGAANTPPGRPGRRTRLTAGAYAEEMRTFRKHGDQWQLTLEHRDDDEGLYHRTVTLRGDGSLVLEGQDLGRGVSDIFGYKEYEFVRTIAADQVPEVRRMLGVTRDKELRAALEERFARPGGSRGFEQSLEAHNIPSEFWSRIGD